MPLYEYQCDRCGCPFEITRPITDPREDVVCPHCGHGQVHRLISPTCFVLEGGGWASDGYGRKPAKHQREMI